MSIHPKYFLQKTERSQFLVDNLNLPKASGIDDAVWAVIDQDDGEIVSLAFAQRIYD